MQGVERGEGEVRLRGVVSSLAGSDYHRMSLYVGSVRARVAPCLQSADVLRLSSEHPRLYGGHDGLAEGVGESCKTGQVVEAGRVGDSGGLGLEQGGDVGSVRGLQGVAAGDGAQCVRPGGRRQAGDHQVGVADGLRDELCMVVELEVCGVIEFISC